MLANSLQLHFRMNRAKSLRNTKVVSVDMLSTSRSLPRLKNQFSVFPHVVWPRSTRT